MGEQAEALGVDLFPGFAAAEILYTDSGAVKGVATGDMGVARDGTHTEHYRPGMELHARYTVFAEGSRGQLGRQLIERYKLDAGRDPQSRSEEHTSELQSLMRISYAVFCLKKKTHTHNSTCTITQ